MRQTPAGLSPLTWTRGKENGEGTRLTMRVSVYATVIWARTGVKVQPEPFATIDRARLMSTVSLVVVPDRTSNGVTAFASPDGTLNTTVVPSSILPVAAM